MARLFEEGCLGSLILCNRIVVAPMCQYSAENGCSTEWHAIHLGGLALGGPGLIILEATGVLPEGRISPYCLGLWDDVTEAALRKTVEAVKRVAPETPLAIQLAHAGRKASVARPWEGGRQLTIEQGGWQTKAPSAIPFSRHDAAPEALTLNEIQHVVDAFAQAAARAVRIGLDAIEIHAAHGYLLHQFLSPLSNQRTDHYGGTLENRMRIVLEVFAAIKAAVPKDFPVGIRISATDWVEAESSWTLDQSITLIETLKNNGLTWVDVSSGALSTAQKIPVGPGYQVPLAQAIKTVTGVPTMAVGLITAAEHAESILQQNQADYIALARAFIYNPRWVWHAARELGVSVKVARQYLRGYPHSSPQLFV